MGRCGTVVDHCGSLWDRCGSLWVVVGPLWVVVGSLWIVVDHCGSLWDRCGSLWDRCGSLWVVVDRCGSLWVVPGFSNYVPLSPELNNLEMVMCAVKLPRSRPLLIGSVYRPPDDKNFTGLFMKYLEQLTFESSEVFLLGVWVISICIFYRQKEKNLSIQ